MLQSLRNLPRVINQVPNEKPISPPFLELGIITLLLTIVVVTLWLPFGLRYGGAWEEWIAFGFLDGAAQNYVIQVEIPTRPFGMGMASIAFIISPDNFMGFNILTIVLFIIKGVLFYCILRMFFPDYPHLCALAALLFIIYPADRGNMTVRIVHIHFALVCQLLATYLFFRSWFTPHLWIWILMGVCQILCLGTYEAGIILLLYTPFFLVVFDRQVTARVRTFALVWYTAPMFYLTYLILFVYLRSETQQATMMRQQIFTNSGNFILQALESVYNLYLNHFWTGWYEALQQFFTDNPYWYLIVPTACILGAICGWIVKQPDEAKPFSLVRSWLVGLLLVLAGFAIFMVTPRVDQEWRVYIFSAPGAALVAALAATAAARRSKFLFGITSTFLILLALVFTINQHRDMVNIALGAQQMLSSIIEDVPRLNQPAYIVVQNHDTENMGLLFNHGLLGQALAYLYSDYENLIVATTCFDGEHDICTPIESGISIGAVTPSGEPIVFLYSELIIFEYDGQTGLQLITHDPDHPEYRPLDLIDTGAAPPPRVYTAFDTYPMPFMPRRINNRSTFER